jgi:hypothetical protein
MVHQIEATTYAGYERAVRHATRHLGDIRLQAVSPGHLNQLYAERRASGGRYQDPKPRRRPRRPATRLGSCCPAVTVDRHSGHWSALRSRTTRTGSGCTRRVWTRVDPLAVVTTEHFTGWKSGCSPSVSRTVRPGPSSCEKPVDEEPHRSKHGGVSHRTPDRVNNNRQDHGGRNKQSRDAHG